jgi:hypothetical protein
LESIQDALNLSKHLLTAIQNRLRRIMALINYRYPSAFVSVDCICFRPEQKSEIPVTICLISGAADPTVDPNSKSMMESFAPAPATPMMLAIAPISAMGMRDDVWKTHDEE